MCSHECEVFLVDVLVADRVDESVDTRPVKILGVVERRRPPQVREHLHAERVRFIDDRPVHVGLKLWS